MKHSNHAERGNVLFILLIAVVLIAGLTYAITSSNRGGENLSAEKTLIAADAMSSFGVDIKRGIEMLTRQGKSESTISFASPSLSNYGTADTTPDAEVFNIRGGGVAFVDVPSGINDGSPWEFYGFTRAPGVGDDTQADLMLVLPNVNQNFCKAYNRKAGYADNAAIPTDSAACLHDTSKRFSGTFADTGTANTMDTGTFRTPAGFACVACGTSYHAYYVIIDR
ncbi:MAG: hypothetical protein KGQ41_06065 [Alphaproteobacteria bacterium]|nr:hypothetical protein [Alphaproteobacteria bacterium]